MNTTAELISKPGDKLPEKPLSPKPPEDVQTIKPAELVSELDLQGEKPIEIKRDGSVEIVDSVPLGVETAQPVQIKHSPSNPSDGSQSTYFPETPILEPDGQHPKGCRCAKCPPWTGKQGRHPNGCRCGRCKQPAAGSAPSARPGLFNDLETKPENSVDYKAQAEMLFDLSTNTLAGFVGPEWLPVKAENGRPGEREIICNALAKYLETKQMVDLPPGYMVLFLAALYTLPRLREENTQNVIKKAWTAICDVWFWLKGKFS